MKKTYIITFVVSLLVLFTVGIIGLMILIPQQSKVITGNINKYEGIKKSQFTFEATKEISENALIKQYTLSTEDMQKFTSGKQYKPGNADPFTAAGSEGNGNGGGTTTNPDDKTTNGNGGEANPPATNK